MRVTIVTYYMNIFSN